MTRSAAVHVRARAAERRPQSSSRMLGVMLTVIVGGGAAVAAGGCGCTAPASAPPRPSAATPSHDGSESAAPMVVPVRTRFEAELDVPDRTVHPDDVVIDARFIGPSGAAVTTGGFASHGRFRVRFTPREPGRYSFVIRADGGTGPREVLRGALRATPSWSAGFVGVDPKDHHRLVREDGQQVFMLGESDPTWRPGGAELRAHLGRMASLGMSTLRVSLSDCASEASTARRGIGCLEPTVGRFDEETADAIDTLFEAGEHFGIDVIPVAFSRAAELSSAPEMRRQAVRRLRYIADRWAASPRFLALDLLDEAASKERLPEGAWTAWATATSRDWRRLDPWKHPVTTGSAAVPSGAGGGLERTWFTSEEDVIVQWKLHADEAHDARAVALAVRRRVEDTYGLGKPVLCGELAPRGEEGRSYDQTHNGIWSALLSGAGALARGAPTFEGTAAPPIAPGRGVHFQVLSGFLQRFGKMPLSRRRDVRVLHGGAEVWSLASDDDASRALWLLGGAKGYGSAVAGVELAVPAPPGRYAVVWVDDTTGAEIATDDVASSPAGEVVLSAPPFLRHVAATLVRQ